MLRYELTFNNGHSALLLWGGGIFVVSILRLAVLKKNVFPALENEHATLQIVFRS